VVLAEVGALDQRARAGTDVDFVEVGAQFEWRIAREEDWYALSRGERATKVAYLQARSAVDHAMHDEK
jgi:hypothetical protein